MQPVYSYLPGFLLVLLLMVQPVSAQNPFACDGKLYFFQRDLADPRDTLFLAYIDNYITAAPTVTTICMLPDSFNSVNTINAMGANLQDGYLYFMRYLNTGVNAGELLRIDSTCNITRVCDIDYSVIGTFDNLGRYWSTDSSDKLVAYDVTNCQVVKGPYNTPIKGSDVTFNVFDNHLYFAAQNQTTKVDTNGIVVDTLSGFGPPMIIGHSALGMDGNLYAMHNGTVSVKLQMLDLATDQTNLNVFTFSPATPGNGNSDMASFVCNLVLPVGLSSFRAALTDNNSALVQWETTPGNDIASFAIQRSANGIQFSSLKKIDAQANPNGNGYYAFTDHEPQRGINYYRLQQTSLDGNFSYSHTVSLTVDGQALVIGNTVMKGNNLLCQLHVPDASVILAEVYDMNGKILARHQQRCSSGMNEISMKLKNTNSGLYLLRAIDQEKGTIAYSKFQLH